MILAALSIRNLFRYSTRPCETDWTSAETALIPFRISSVKLRLVEETQWTEPWSPCWRLIWLYSVWQGYSQNIMVQRACKGDFHSQTPVLTPRRHGTLTSERSVCHTCCMLLKTKNMFAGRITSQAGLISH